MTSIGNSLRALAMVLACSGPALAQSQLAQMMPGGHMHGADGTGHDMMTMPGLRGLDATPEESAELQVMFMNFPGLSREVDLLDNGIRTYTWSDDPALAAVLVSHVAGMLNRVEEGRDPQVFIQSPTLDILFARRDTIATEVDVTDSGIWVTQTSTDPEVVAALQTHAGEVSDMAARGMQAVHEMMMQRAAGQ
ncbi:hypothetical protein [Sinisalibacter aestuarii]|uniref:ABC-type transport auxiliary lipoprotein component domain-containing protein n=1 Tax=Sinisalibacter aestuarii TaxID=2949426 RepID=A0ABQ5LUV5_9RHOB|nr:hypothetical protein [Sinisalibacter aestuarii]GKY88543.1 hypothetical protein STA1M1_24120 [Sinisalibacter aestuarii]